MTNKVFTLRRYSEENKAYREYEMQVNNITESEALQIYYEGRPNFGKTYMAKLSDVEKLEINLAYNCYYNEMLSKVSVDDLRNFKKVLRVKVLKSIITLTDNLTNNDYEWMLDNSYKYGFIVRYPKGKQHITQFMEEPWHLRYLGVKGCRLPCTKVHGLVPLYWKYILRVNSL